MNNQFTKDAEKLYQKYNKMLWWYSHKFGVDIGDLEIAFMECVKKHNSSKASFSTHLWLKLRHTVFKVKRDENAEKRRTDKMIVAFDIDWLGVTHKQSIWQFAKEVLTEDEYNIIYDNIFLGKSQCLMAKDLGISQAKLSRDIVKIINKLKENIKGC